MSRIKCDKAALTRKIYEKLALPEDEAGEIDDELSESRGFHRSLKESGTIANT